MIRYDKKLNNEIAKTIRNFNNKIRRLEKLGRDLDLPEKVTRKDLTSTSYTRKELKRKLERLKSFSKRGAEESIKLDSGLMISKYEYENLKKDLKRAKLKANYKIQYFRKTKGSIFGERVEETYARMGDEDFIRAKARRKALEKDIKQMNKDEIKRFKKLINNVLKYNEINPNFKQNSLELIMLTGTFYGYDTNKLQTIVDRLNSLDDKTYYEIYYNERSIKAIEDYYRLIAPKGFDINLYTDDVSMILDELYDNLEKIINRYSNG